MEGSLVLSLMLDEASFLVYRTLDGTFIRDYIDVPYFVDARSCRPVKAISQQEGHSGRLLGKKGMRFADAHDFLAGVSSMSLQPLIYSDVAHLTLKLLPINFSSKHLSFTISKIYDRNQRPPLPNFCWKGADNNSKDDMPGARVFKTKPPWIGSLWSDRGGNMGH
ncbi:hypothetical protein Bca4012_056079 [Brassica carinata]